MLSLQICLQKLLLQEQASKSIISITVITAVTYKTTLESTSSVGGLVDAIKVLMASFVSFRDFG